MKNMVMFNIVAEPLKIEHIGYLTKDGGDYHIVLREVVEVTYPHPDAPDVATVTNRDKRPALNAQKGSRFRTSCSNRSRQ